MKDYIVSYREIQEILHTAGEERLINEILLSAAHEEIENYLQRTLLEKSYTQTFYDAANPIYLRQWPIQEILKVYDETLNEEVPIEAMFETNDIDNRFIIQERNRGHTITIEYRSGYERGQMPAILKETVITLFSMKKRTMKNIEEGKENNTDEAYMILPRNLSGYTYKRI